MTHFEVAENTVLIFCWNFIVSALLEHVNIAKAAGEYFHIVMVCSVC